MSDRVERLKGNHFSLCQSKMERNIEINIETISTGFFFFTKIYMRYFRVWNWLKIMSVLFCILKMLTSSDTKTWIRQENVHVPSFESTVNAGKITCTPLKTEEIM